MLSVSRFDLPHVIAVGDEPLGSATRYPEAVAYLAWNPCLTAAFTVRIVSRPDWLAERAAARDAEAP